MKSYISRKFPLVTRRMERKGDAVAVVGLEMEVDKGVL